MKVFKVKDKASWWWVESQSLECVKCKKLFSRSETRYADLLAGGACPKVCGGTLDIRFHICGLAAMRPVGTCSCEGFTMSKRKHFGGKTPLQFLRDMTQEQRDNTTHRQRRELRCIHLDAAREAALELAVYAHDRETADDVEGQGP